MAETLGLSVLREIRGGGPLSAEALADSLSESVTSVQRILLDNTQLFAGPADDDTWSLVGTKAVSRELGMPRILRPWQAQAFQVWVASNRRGVVEAVTGAGKTDVGVAAIADARRRGLPAVVLVPDRVLVDQWVEVLEATFPDVKICTPDGSKVLAVSEKIVVCTAAGLGTRGLTAFRSGGLIVVDEIQRIGVTEYTDVVFKRQEFSERIGLTAAYEWVNPQTERILQPYFGARIEGCDYRRAVDEGILARPLLLTVGVSFTPGEREEYDALADRIDRAARKLRDTGVDLSRGLYETAREIDSGALVGEISYLAHEYLEAVDERRWVLSECKSKADAVADLVHGLQDAHRTTVFTASDDMSAGVVRAVDGSGLKAEAVAANADTAFTLGRYSSGATQMLATSRLLDEGVHVPTSQVGVVVAAARSRAQMLQRMGRVVHPVKWAGRTAMVIIYVNGTVEDPDVGSTVETHLDPLVAIAAERADADAQEGANRLAAWLATDDGDVASAGDDVVAVDTDTDRWSVQDAIKDIFAEYEGLLTWRELREVLPDLEAETVLMNGIDGITWMSVGDALLGAGFASSTLDDRISALDSLRQAFLALGGRTVRPAQILKSLDGQSLLAEHLDEARLSELWTELGGHVSEERSEPVDGDPNQPLPSVEKAPQSPPSASTVRSEAEETDGISALGTTLVLESVGKLGGSTHRSEANANGVLRITGRDGRTRTVRVEATNGTGWDISTREKLLTDAHSTLNAVVLVDLEQTPGAIFIVRAPVFRARLKSLVHAAIRANRHNPRIRHVHVAPWVVKEGLGRWDLLGLSEVDTRDGTSKNAGPEAGEQVHRIARRPSRVVRSVEGELRVVLKYHDKRVVGYFEPSTSELRIESAQGLKYLEGKTFRNPAVAAGTVKSRIAHKTIFGVGFNDWVVDENTHETLAAYRSGEGD